MFVKTFLIVCFAVLSFGITAQETFELSDINLHVGQTKTFHNIRFDLNKRELLLDSVCQSVLDSIETFLFNHPELAIEIGVHTDFRGWKYRSSHLTEGRANNLAYYFIERGISPDKVIPVGYEIDDPIYTEEYVNQFVETDKETYERLCAANRRVVLKVIDHFKKEFTFSDTTFEAGQSYTTRSVRFNVNEVDLIIDDSTQRTLDSLVNFLKDHDDLLIDLGWHTSSLEIKERGYKLCDARVYELQRYLVGRGCNPFQIKPVCYGNMKPIYKEEFINQFKDSNSEEFHRLHRENQRLVLRILKVNWDGVICTMPRE